MKSWKKISLIVLTVALMAVWSGFALAGEMEAKNVSADAVWVAHLNIDAAKSSKVVQKYFEECLKDDCMARFGMEMIKRHLSLANFSDLHNITAYGVSLKPHKGVVIIQGTFDKEALLKKVEKAPDHETHKYGNYEIHSWEMRGGRMHGHETAGTLYKPDVLVISSSVDALKSALDVLDGKQKNIADKASPLGAAVPAGTIFLVRAVDINKSEFIKENHPILKQIEQVDYCKGQEGDKWTGKLTIVTTSKTAADDLKDVVKGFWSLIALYYHENKPITEAIDNIKVTAEDNTVKMVFEENADKLIEQLPAICKATHQHFLLRKHWE